MEIKELDGAGIFSFLFWILLRRIFLSVSSRSGISGHICANKVLHEEDQLTCLDILEVLQLILLELRKAYSLMEGVSWEMC